MIGKQRLQVQSDVYAKIIREVVTASVERELSTLRDEQIAKLDDKLRKLKNKILANSKVKVDDGSLSVTFVVDVEVMMRESGFEV